MRHRTVHLHRRLPQTPCTARATGADGLDVDVPVTYEDNTDAGTATASATYPGDANHTGGTDTETFVIGQADAVCTVTGYTGTYDGNPHGATGTCTGVDGEPVTGLDLGGPSRTPASTPPLDLRGRDQLRRRDRHRDRLHRQGTDRRTVVTCPVSVVYDGSAQEPCTAEVTGAGGLEQSLSASYTDNTDAGTATASAPTRATTTTPAPTARQFEITKAHDDRGDLPGRTVRLHRVGDHPACTASTTGAGGLSVSPTVTFAGNTTPASATASADVRRRRQPPGHPARRPSRSTRHRRP